MAEKEIHRYADGEMTPPETESWMKYAWEMKQKTPDRIEDAAKFLATMISISLSVFLALMRLDPALKQGGLEMIVPAIWIVSLIIALYVLYPRDYRHSSDSAASIESMTEDIIAKKRSRLFLAVVSFVAGFLVFGIAVIF